LKYNKIDSKELIIPDHTPPWPPDWTTSTFILDGQRQNIWAFYKDGLVHFYLPEPSREDDTSDGIRLISIIHEDMALAYSPTPMIRNHGH